MNFIKSQILFKFYSLHASLNTSFISSISTKSKAVLSSLFLILISVSFSIKDSTTYKFLYSIAFIKAL